MPLPENAVTPDSTPPSAPHASGDSRVARWLPRYAWGVLAYNVAVILWGAVVRASGSGNGCGDHWPLCEGQVIPHAAQIATVIEFAHRLTSGVAVVLVVGLLAFSLRCVAAGHPGRRYAAAALGFTLVEGLIGAALVLLGDTGTNASMGRVAILSVHLVNTFLLLAALALAARAFGAAGRAPGEEPRPGGGLSALYGAGLLGTLAVAVTGTIAALSDTLFHVTSLATGLQLDFAATSSPMLRLRIVHPVLAVTVAGLLLALAGRTRASAAAPPRARRLAARLAALVVLQLGIGASDVALLAPLWIQVLHLLTADLIWIVLVLLSAEMWPVPATGRAPRSRPAAATGAGVTAG